MKIGDWRWEGIAGTTSGIRASLSPRRSQRYNRRIYALDAVKFLETSTEPPIIQRRTIGLDITCPGHTNTNRPEKSSMIQRDEISKNLKSWERLDSPKRISSSLKVISISFVCSSFSFILGAFSFLSIYCIRGIAHTELFAPISNLLWSIPFLAALQFFTHEPFLRIAFYSFIAPSLIFGIYRGIALIIS